MEVDKLQLGCLKTNCYFIKKGNLVLIVDPADEFNKIKKYLYDNNLKLIGVLITHYHFDHIGALEELKKEYDVLVIDYKSSELVSIEDFKFQIVKTYGHTQNSVSFYFEEEQLLFCGDFIFKDSIGRIDLDGSNRLDMIKSIEKIKKFNKDIKLFPGHGEETTLNYELNNNLFIKDVNNL